jgi:glycosyltransferase involved in cell wall biosynthesis
LHSFPLVSICIPTFNGGTFLHSALVSILSQTYDNIEVVISDDSSIDDTLAIVKQFKKVANIPVHIYTHKPSGIGANWNNCIRKANGKYIKFLFQDDILLETCIEKMVNVLESNKKIGLVACKRGFLVNTSFNDEDTRNWINNYKDLQVNLNLRDLGDYQLLTKTVFRSNNFLKIPLNKIGEPSTYMFPESLVNKIGFFREDLKQVLDYEFCFRVLKVKHLAILNDELVKFRLHDNQATKTNRGNDGNDYKILNRLIYKEYFWLVNLKLKLRLLKQFNPYFKLLISLIRKLKKG